MGTGTGDRWVLVREGVGLPLLPDHPGHCPGPAPCGRCPARDTSARADGWLGMSRYYPPGIPHPGTTPVYPPWYHPPAPHVTAARVHHGRGATGTCTYDSFEHVVGEPRGVEHSRVFRVPGWFILLLRFARPFDWVLTSILLSLGPVLLSLTSILLSLGPVLLNYGPILLSLGPVLLNYGSLLLLVLYTRLGP